MFKLTFLRLGLALVLFAGVVQAQNLDEQLQKLAGSAGKVYITPLVTNLGVNLNTGWMNRAPEKKRLGFDFEFGIVAMQSVLTSDAAKSFSLSTGFRFDKSQAMDLTASVTDPEIRNQVVEQITTQDLSVQIAGATIYGSAADKITVYFAGKTFTVNSAFPVTVTLPSKTIDLGIGGQMGGVKSLPGGAPQIKLGTLFGTRAIVRMLPSIDLGNSVGKFSYFGFGLEHNLSYWLDNYLPMIPLDISAGFLTQTSKIGSAVKFTGTTSGMNLSKKFEVTRRLAVTPYAGFAMESSTLSVNITQKLETLSGTTETNIAFDVEGAGKSRFNIGAYIKFFLLGLDVEYSAAKAGTISGSLMFNF